MNANKGKENKNLQDGQRNRKRTRNDRRKAKEAARAAAAAAAAAVANTKNVKNEAINIYSAQQLQQQKTGFGIGGVGVSSDFNADNRINGPSTSGQEQQQQEDEEEEQQRVHEQRQRQRVRQMQEAQSREQQGILSCELSVTMPHFSRHWKEGQPSGAPFIPSTHNISASSSQSTSTSPWETREMPTQQAAKKISCPMRTQNHYSESQLGERTPEALQSQTTTITPNDDDLNHIQSGQLPSTYTQSLLDLNTADWLSDFRRLSLLPSSIMYCSQIESQIFAQMANLTRSFTPLGMQFNLPQLGGRCPHCNTTTTMPGTSFPTQFDAHLGSTTPPASCNQPPLEQFGSQFGSRFGDNIPWDIVLQTMPRDLIDELPSKLLLEMQLPRAPLCDNFVAMDCEMVGIGVDGQTNMVARVSIVNQRGQVLLDKYVKPREFITDYRTAVSGIRPNDFLNADDFCTVQSWVQQILYNRILVGHNVATDLKVLNMFHPFSKIRDTSHYRPLAYFVSNGRTPSLKLLSHVVLGVEIQNGEHDSVEDARAAMGVYNRVADYWESSLRRMYACTN